VILLNFAHPLTPAQFHQIEALTGQKVERVVEIPSQIDPQQPLVPQVTELADRAELSPAEWQTLPILINPPSLHWVAVTLMAELHGRMGSFPPIVRLVPTYGSTPRRYEVAEILDLQEVRDAARRKRSYEG
jgi:hypothetical protein